MSTPEMTSRRQLVCRLVLAVVMVAATTGTVRVSLATPGDPPRFETVDCPVEVPANLAAECGYLIVPETRGAANSRTLRLAVMVLKSRAADSAPDPVVYLEGGPGLPAAGCWFFRAGVCRGVALLGEQMLGDWVRAAPPASTPTKFIRRVARSRREIPRQARNDGIRGGGDVTTSFEMLDDAPR